MRIMTSNIWGDYFGNPVSQRAEQLYDVFQKYNPDILGFQEITESWYKSPLFEKLNRDYQFVGTELRDNDNYVPLIYKKEKFTLLAKGYERLFDTHDPSKAITWAVLESKEDANRFVVCNTHFWWMQGKQEHNVIRNKNAMQLSKLMKVLKEKFECDVFAFGDMNTTISSDIFKVYAKNGIKHLYDLAEEKDNISSHHGDPLRGEDDKYHGSKTFKDSTHSIDHIIALGEEFKVMQYRIVEDQDALDATDHSPVYVDIGCIGCE